MRKIILALLVSLLVIAEAAAQTTELWCSSRPNRLGRVCARGRRLLDSVPQQTGRSYNQENQLHASLVHLYRRTRNLRRLLRRLQANQIRAGCFLLANRDRFIKSMQATLVSNREITVNGHTGIEFTSGNPAANIRSQLFLVENRLFQTVTMILKDVDQTDLRQPVLRVVQVYEVSHKRHKRHKRHKK